MLHNKYLCSLQEALRMKTLLQNIKGLAISLKDLLFPVIITTVIIYLLPYLAFTATLIATIVFTTISCVYWGHALIDFPGMAILPYLALSTGVYLVGFVVLHYLHWKGELTFEVGWVTLGATALSATLTTFVVCLIINRSKQ